MTTQPEALRLADALSAAIKQVDVDDDVIHVARWFVGDAAAKLRRLHQFAEDQIGRAAAAEAALQMTKATHALKIAAVEAQRDALLEALLRIESAVDWYLGRSSFTQTTQLKGLKHSANVRKELFAAHDEVRAAIKAVEEGK